MKSMNPPTGVLLFNLLNEYKNHPLMPKNFEDLLVLEISARKEGFGELADYLENWRMYINYQIRAEWNV